MDEEQSSSIRMKLPPLNPELRDSIRTRLRFCLTCRALKRWSWPFHNAHPETYDRVHARHRLIKNSLPGCGGCGPSCAPRRNEMAPASGSAPGGRAMAEERSPIQHVLVMHRTEVETNVHRFYALMIEHDLFGRTVLVRHWGRPRWTDKRRRAMALSLALTCPSLEDR